MALKRLISLGMSITLILGMCACSASDGISNAVDKATTVAAVQTDCNETLETTMNSIGTENDTDSLQTGEETTEKPGAEPNVTQRNSVAMLNYLMVITEKIKQSSNSKLYLEEVGNAMLNDFYPNAIDKRTQTQIGDLYRLVNSMRMVDVKRERLAYIYDQNKAQAISKAIPSPISILNVVQAKSPLKMIASAVFLAVDSVSSYSNATYANEMQYLKDGWDLDDQMDAQLSALNLDAFNYSQDIIDQYDIDGGLTLSQDMARLLAEWENNQNVSRRVEFLNNHREEYKACGSYWLLLSRSCYELGDSIGCVQAMDEYIRIQPRLFRKDENMAKGLPMVIASLSDVYDGEELTAKEEYYVELLSSNAAMNDWASRYCAAISYMDLYVKTNNIAFLQKAFIEAKTNVNEVKNTINNTNLIDYQLSNNSVYLADVQKAPVPKTATSTEKKEIEKYNDMLKQVRKVELPPVDNALLINVKLMIDLAHELDLPDSELESLDRLIHGDNRPLFLVDSVDANLWASKSVTLEAPEVSFDGERITIPANYVCAESVIRIMVNGEFVETTNPWAVESVKRKGALPSEYAVTYSNKDIGDIQFSDGDIVTISVLPYEEYFDAIEVSFKTVAKKVIVTSYNFEKID